MIHCVIPATEAGPACSQRQVWTRYPAVVVLFLAAVGVDARGQSIQAIRATEAPRLDGRLTEAAWQGAPSVTNLTQREPNEGAPAIENTEVRFAYDDDALYVGARMFSRNPAAIRALITRRDREGSSEQIVVSLDTYRDRRTAYSFSVTPAGVRMDYYHATDSEGDRDFDWNPVWEAATSIDSLGWSAELRIPFNQLRFSPGEMQEWGVNVVRRVPDRNEQSYWALVRRTEPGWSSRMGVLTGISAIRPPRRVEIVPYVAADSRIAAVTDAANPFQETYASALRAGGDLKLGLGPNLTLDVTLNPDFGQVEGDPAVVNLSAYEIFFDERRPFFLEGADLLNQRGLFYSRRIGATPPGSANADYVERLSNSTILGAAKLTGRLPSGLAVAALAALTDREVARTFDAAGNPQFGEAVLAPRTGYAVASARQEFGRDASTFGGIVTVVQRDVDPGTPLADLLPRTAYSGLLEGRLRWAGGGYDVNSWLGYTNVRGDSAAILRQQRSSRRYFQRPDADHVEVDPARRMLGGTTFGLGHSKLAGRHWTWDVDLLHQSPGFEPNDMGSYGAVDTWTFNTRLRWRETVPSRWHRRYEVSAGTNYDWNFDGMRRRNDNQVTFSTTMPNFWRLNSDLTYSQRALSDRLTRGGPMMGTPSGMRWGIELQNRSGARNGWGVDVNGSRDENGGWEQNVEMSFSLRPGDRWEMSFDPLWSRGTDTRQFVTTAGGGRAETFGTRYIFAHVDLSEISGQFRLNYTFTPDLTFETYVEPFAASGRFHSFGELMAPRRRELLVYGTNGTTIVRKADGTYTVTEGSTTFDIGNEDFNERSFRSNAVLRWEWRLGSTLYLVWQQNRRAELPFAPARPGHLFGALQSRGENVLAIKVSYWTALR
jgi:hypothetical protein